MKLSELLSAPLASDHAQDPEIKGLTADSRVVEPGFLFAAIKGGAVDGRRFIPQAAEKGAVAVLSDLEASIPSDVVAVRDDNPRARLARLAAAFYGPGPEALYGVTGTNGKTSTAWFAAQLFASQGAKAASLGTLGAKTADGALSISLNHTTPDPIALHDALAQLRAAGVTSATLEASSHGLVQHRLDGVSFKGAAFSNITHDHLDYHTDFQGYFDAKARLFRDLVEEGGCAVINADGAGADDMAAVAAERGLRVITTGARGKDLRLTALTPTASGLHLCVEAFGETYQFAAPVIGAFQAENALLAAGLAIGSGAPVKAVMDGLSRLSAPPGRMQRAAEAGGAAGYVDYAHTPDAVAAALTAIRPHASGKVIAIVGAGGDRDAVKRGPMGAAAAKGADRVIVTDDNPRSEDPATIRAAVLEGAREVGGDILEIGDRAEAIAAGAAALEPGDVLLVLGKGHETGQIISDRVLPFDDAECVKAAFQARKGRA